MRNFVFVLLAVFTALSSAQENYELPYEPVFIGSIGRLEWSSDSSSLYFESLPKDIIYQLNTNNMIVTEANLSSIDANNLPLQDLTQTLDSRPALAIDSILYSSPSRRFFAFSGSEEKKDFFPLKIWDQINETVIEVNDVFVLFDPTNFSFFNVDWSSNSNSLLVSTLGIAGNPITYLVYNISSGNPATLNLSNESTMAGLVGNIIPFDISKDGNGLLAKRYTNDNLLGRTEELFVWNFVLNEVTRIALAKGLSTAIFVESDRSEVLFVSSDGTFVYDVDRKTLQNVNPEVTSRWIGINYAFSPDGRYLATTRIGYPEELYIVNIR